MIELQSDLEYVITDRLKVSLDAIAQFCQRWNIVEFALFGSVLRDDFRPDSDVDVLVTYERSHRLTFSHLLSMEEEIEDLFHRSVDLVEKKQLKNPYLRSNLRENLSSDLCKRAIGIVFHFGTWRKQSVGFNSLRLISLTVA